MPDPGHRRRARGRMKHPSYGEAVAYIADKRQLRRRQRRASVRLYQRAMVSALFSVPVKQAALAVYLCRHPLGGRR